MKKLMIFFPYFYPHIGGVENYILNIAGRLKDKYEIVIVTCNHENNKLDLKEIKGFKTYRLPYWFNVSNTPVNPLWYFQIKKIIKKEKPDFINAHMPVPFMVDVVTLLSPKKTFVTYHNDVIKSGYLNYLCKAYYLLIGNRTLKNCKRIIATSDLYVDNSPYLKSFKNKISIVSPGVDLNIFNNKIKKGFFKSRNKKIVFIAQLDKTHHHKGLNYLLASIKEIVKEIPNIHLYVCGKGDNLPIYKEIVKKLKIETNVSFLGFVPDEDLPKIYRDADLLVLPSYNSAEGFGMVLAEANACGTPIIGSKIGGIPVVIENEYNGLLVPPKDIKELSKAIQRVLNDEKFAEKLSQNGIKKAKENWDWDKLAEKTLEVYEK